jgi:hypothetical protein
MVTQGLCFKDARHLMVVTEERRVRGQNPHALPIPTHSSLVLVVALAAAQKGHPRKRVASLNLTRATYKAKHPPNRR